MNSTRKSPRRSSFYTHAIAFLTLACSVALLVSMVGCSSNNSSSTPPPPQSVTVNVSSSSSSVLLGNTQQFAANVMGTSNTAVTWSVNGIAGGNSTVGTISSSGLFAAPQDLPNPASVKVTATSQADPNAAGSASIMITSDIAVTVATVPSGTVAVPTSRSLQFTANLASNGNPDKSLVWSVNGITNGNSSVGMVSGSTSNTTYTAPSSVPNPATVMIQATSVADSSKAGSSQITLFVSVLNGGSNSTAQLPTPSPVTYTTKQSQTLTSNFAYPGFVELFADPSTAESTITNAIQSQGGSVFEALPKAGLYSVALMPGQEASFLSGIYSNPWLVDGAPLAPGSDATVTVIDNFTENTLTTNPCAQFHGQHVVGVLQSRTPSSTVSTDDLGGFVGLLSLWYNNGSTYQRYANHIAKAMEASYQNGQRSVINFSIQSFESEAQPSTNQAGCSSGLCTQVRHEQTLLWSTILQTLQNADPKVLDNTTVVVAAGNAGLDVDVQLQALRNQFPEAWKHVRIVGGTDASGSINPVFNNSNSNMLFTRGVQVSTLGDLCDGTSFAAPEVARIIDFVWQQLPNLTSSQILAAIDATLALKGLSAIPQDPSTGATTQDFLNSVVANARAVGGSTLSVFAGSFTGSTTQTGLACTWRHTVSGSGTVTVTGNGTSTNPFMATFTFAGQDRITVLPGSQPQCTGNVIPLSGNGTASIDANDMITAHVSAGAGTGDFAGTFTTSVITGTLTINSAVFDSAIVGPLTLTRQ